MELSIAIVWITLSVLATALSIFFWITISRTTSRKNGFHAFVASLLTSRVIFCLGVTSLFAFHVFLNADWTVLACHALYWIWTVTWMSDIIAVCAMIIWGIIKLRHLRSAFRLGATIAIAGIWLLATTSAGTLAYFNKRIKDADDLAKNGCDVMPNLNESALAIGVFSFLVLSLVTSMAFMVAFVVNLRNSLRAAHDEANSTSHISVNAQTVHGELRGQVIRVPSRLEDIEEYHVRRGTRSQAAIVDAAEEQKLVDWRNAMLAALVLMFLLNALPHLVLLCFHILRRESVPNGNTILITCHLVYSILLPVVMINVSKEYKEAARGILFGRTHQKKDSRVTIQRSNALSRGRQVTGNKTAVTSAANTSKSNGHQTLSQSAATDELTADINQLPKICRSGSKLSRLEWKEHMLKSAKLPVHMPPETQVEVQVERKVQQDSSDTDSDGVSDGVSGRFSESDIERVLGTPSPPRIVVNDETASIPSDINQQIAVSMEQPAQPGTVSNGSAVNPVTVPEREDSPDSDSKRRKRDQKREKRARGIYQTISRALGMDEDLVANAQHPRPVSRSDMVYSPTNPFIRPLQEEVDVDTESERSVEAEIVAITIRGRGTFKRKLRRKGLLPGQTYLTNHTNITENSSIHIDRAYSNLMQNTRGENGPESRPVSTNPFITGIDESERQTPQSYTRDWVENRQGFHAYDLASHRPNPFLNYGFVADNNEEIKRRWSSNPFLQDIGSEDQLPLDHVPDTEITRDEFVTRSAPTSPTLDRRRSMKPAALAVSVVELLNSKSENLATYDLGQTPVIMKPAHSEGSVTHDVYVTEYL